LVQEFIAWLEENHEPGICGGRHDVSVCGCDGATYENWCEALFASVNVAHEGACGCPEILCPFDTYPADPDDDGCIDECTSLRCETNADCTDDRWCNDDFTVGDCAAPGLCTERPLGCADVWMPVCGCDGNTYSNACHADAAGVRIAHEGRCGCGKCPDEFFPIPGVDGCPIACIGPPCETTCRGTTCTIVCTGVEPS
jgi:hypothetical protein